MLELFRVIYILTRFRIWGYLYRKSNDAAFGEALSLALQKLGPVYIKLGQTLSTRADIIGPDLASSLAGLQDKLPPFSHDKAIKIFESETGRQIADIFAEFDKDPVAAASIAQVHKATLQGGRKVAVKIMRPDIAKEYAKDIRFLYFIAKILEKRYPKLKPVSMIDIFHASMKRELDFRLEASAYSEMRDNFINDDSVYIPEVHWAATTQKVLVTSWVDGVSIYNRKEVLKLGIDPISLSEKVAVMFFNQSYRDGFFHADLHPGNIFVTKDARIALIDFGITGRLREEDRFAVAEIVFGIIKRDYIFVAKTYKHAGYISKNTDIYLFAERTRAICEPIAGLALKDISLAKILEQLFNFTEEFDMTAQPQLILLQKSMVILEGIGLSLNSDINMWKLAEPWIKKWAVKNISPEAKLIRLVKNWIEERF